MGILRICAVKDGNISSDYCKALQRYIGKHLYNNEYYYPLLYRLCNYVL